MTPVSLEAFLYEYRLSFPVGVDLPDGSDGIPQTMRAYGMQGSPTLVLIDAFGNVRNQHLGQLSDLSLGAQIMELILESGALSQ